MLPLAQVFFCEFCEDSKNIYSYRIPPAAASGDCENSGNVNKARKYVLLIKYYVFRSENKSFEKSRTLTRSELKPVCMNIFNSSHTTGNFLCP